MHRGQTGCVRRSEPRVAATSNRQTRKSDQSARRLALRSYPDMRAETCETEHWPTPRATYRTLDARRSQREPLAHANRISPTRGAHVHDDAYQQTFPAQLLGDKLAPGLSSRRSQQLVALHRVRTIGPRPATKSTAMFFGSFIAGPKYHRAHGSLRFHCAGDVPAPRHRDSGFVDCWLRVDSGFRWFAGRRRGRLNGAAEMQ